METAAILLGRVIDAIFGTVTAAVNFDIGRALFRHSSLAVRDPWY